MASAAKFDALRSAIYHTSRRGFLELCSRLLNLVVVFSGTVAAADLGLLVGLDESQKWFAFAAALAGLFQLAFDPAGLARTHEFLQRRFYEILAEMAEKSKPTESDEARWKGALFRLYAEEKPPLRALDAISYNAAAESLGYGKDKLITIRWWHTALSQVMPFNGTSF